MYVWEVNSLQFHHKKCPIPTEVSQENHIRLGAWEENLSNLKSTLIRRPK